MGEKRLKVYFDSEFTGLHQRTTLVSIGLVAETGETFYAELDNWDREALKDKWFAENVAAHLLYDAPFTVRGFPGDVRMKADGQEIRKRLEFWFKVLVEGHNVANIEIWSDCLAYDWVLFCELWGGALKVPDEIYYIPFDLSTLLWQAGEDPDINREALANLSVSEADKHNALWDARVIRSCCEKLIGAENSGKIWGDYGGGFRRQKKSPEGYNPPPVENVKKPRPTPPPPSQK